MGSHKAASIRGLHTVALSAGGAKNPTYLESASDDGENRCNHDTLDTSEPISEVTAAETSENGTEVELFGTRANGERSKHTASSVRRGSTGKETDNSHDSALLDVLCDYGAFANSDRLDVVWSRVHLRIRRS